MAYALIQSGTFGTMPDKMKVMNGTVERRTALREITGAGDGLAATFAYGRPTWVVNFTGVYTSDGSTFPMPVVGTGITGSPLAVVSRAVVVMSQNVKNTTGAADSFAASVWTPGVKTYRGSIFGWLANPDTVLSDKTTDYAEGAAGSDTLTLPIYSTGPVQITGTYRITSYRVGTPFKEGGAIPVTMGFVYTGTVTDTNTPFAIGTDGDYDNLAFNLNTGEDWSAVDVVPYQIRLDIDYENAVPTVVSCAGPISGAFTIT